MPEWVRAGGTDRFRSAVIIVWSAGIPSIESVEVESVWVGSDCIGTTLQQEAASICAVDTALAEADIASAPKQQMCAEETEGIAQRLDAKPGTPERTNSRIRNPVLGRYLIVNLYVSV